MTSPTPQPDVINKLRFAAYSSFAMYAGMKLEVFTPLKDGPLTVQNLAQSLNVNPTRLGPLLYALVVAELLTVEDDSFANTPEAAQFLIKGNPGYMGGLHGVLTEQWTAAMKVAEGDRSWRTALRAPHCTSPISAAISRRVCGSGSPQAWAANPVIPVPQKPSNTTSPGRV